MGFEGGTNAYAIGLNTLGTCDPLGLYKTRRKNGQFAGKPGPKPQPDPNHGNSANSTKPNLLYAMVHIDPSDPSKETFQKWGITSEKNAADRYGNQMPKNCEVRPIAKGSRKDMLALERELTEKMPGPLNKESWAGKQSGSPLSPAAQKAKGNV